MNRRLQTKRYSFVLLAWVLFIFCLPLLTAQTSSAVGSKFKQQILPIDCVFEIINDGLNSVVYLTPEECGVVVEPPIDPEVEEPVKPTPKPTNPVVTVIDDGERIFYQTPLPIYGGYPTTPTDVVSLPFYPLTGIDSTLKSQSTVNAKNDAAAVVPVALVLVALGGIAILAVLLRL